MTRLAIGTAQFGLTYGVANAVGRIPDTDAAAILDHAWRSGVRTLDTAIAYGDSESRLGTLGVAHWRVVSKLPALPDTVDAAQWVSDQVGGSLRRLRRGTLSALLLHQPRQLLESGGDRLFDALLGIKAAGLVEKIGISIYEPAELVALTGRFAIDLVQAPFSILDRRLIDTNWLARLSAAGVELHARSIFLQGLLLMPAATRPQQFSRWAPLWSRWDTWLHDAGLSPVEVCLRYALSIAEIGCVVVGVDSVRQLDEILAAADGPVPPVPADIATNDPDLLNPSRWTNL